MYDLLTLRKNKSLMYRLRKDYRIVRARGGASILGLAGAGAVGIVSWRPSSRY